VASTIFFCSAYSSTLKMKAKCSSEKLVDFQRNEWWCIPKGRIQNNYRYEKLKSYKNEYGYFWELCAMEPVLVTPTFLNDMKHAMHTLILPAEELTSVCTPFCRSNLNIIFKCDLYVSLILMFTFYIYKSVL
jgi:hypothetical protein